MKIPYLEKEDRASLAHCLNQLLAAESVEQLQMVYHEAIENHRPHYKFLESAYEERKNCLESGEVSQGTLLSLALFCRQIEQTTEETALTTLFHEAVQRHPDLYPFITTVFDQRKADLGIIAPTSFSEKEKKDRKRWLISLFSLASYLVLAVAYLVAFFTAKVSFEALLETNEQLKEVYENLLAQGITFEEFFNHAFTKHPFLLIDFTTVGILTLLAALFISLIVSLYYYCSYKKKGTELLKYSLIWFSVKLFSLMAAYLTFVNDSEGASWYEHLPFALFFALTLLLFTQLLAS